MTRTAIVNKKGTRELLAKIGILSFESLNLGEVLHRKDFSLSVSIDPSFLLPKDCDIRKLVVLGQFGG